MWNTEVTHLVWPRDELEWDYNRSWDYRLVNEVGKRTRGISFSFNNPWATE